MEASETKKIYLVDVGDFERDKMLNGGYANFAATNKKLACSLIRRAAALFKDEQERLKAKPAVTISYDESLVINGKCRIYYNSKALKKRVYREWRILELPYCKKLADLDAALFGKCQDKK